MQTHEDSEARRRFEIVNQVLGWGNPRAPIWFIGLEEAGEWSTDDSKNKEELQKYEKCSTGWMPVEPGAIQRDAGKNGQGYTKIYIIMSKLLLEITGGKLADWPDYCKKLFVDEIACQANLYPLAKKRHSDPLPPHYADLFGFWSENEEQYRKIVNGERFHVLSEKWVDAKPAITVCFGQGEWKQFKNLFGSLLGDRRPESKVDDYCELYSSGIVLTPFFTPMRGCMKDQRIKSLGESLRPLWLGNTSHLDQL